MHTLDEKGLQRRYIIEDNIKRMRGKWKQLKKKKLPFRSAGELTIAAAIEKGRFGDQLPFPQLDQLDGKFYQLEPHQIEGYNDAYSNLLDECQSFYDHCIETNGLDSLIARHR